MLSRRLLAAVALLLAAICANPALAQSTTSIAVLDANGNAQTLATFTDSNGHQHYKNVDEFVSALGQPADVSPTTPLPVTAADQVPSTQNITTQDLVSTSSTVQGGQVWWIGTPTSGSAASFALNGVELGSLVVSGTWTGTLQFETSRDPACAKWTPRAIHPDGVSSETQTVTANVQGDVKLAGATCLRVRATAAMTGTAVVSLVESTNPVRLDADVIGNLQLSNGGGNDPWIDTKALDSGATAGVEAAGSVIEDNNGGSFTSLPELADVRDRQVSAANTQFQRVYDLRNAKAALAIEAVCSAGSATLEVDGSSDDANWLELDLLTAAATQTKFYGTTTTGATLALSPLAFRWVRVTEGACGSGDTSTTTIAAK
jgi:hypothetical protein